MKLAFLLFLTFLTSLKAEETVFQKTISKKLKNLKLLEPNSKDCNGFTKYISGDKIIKDECKNSSNCIISKERRYRVFDLYDSFKGKKLENIKMYLSYKQVPYVEVDFPFYWIGSGDSALYSISDLGSTDPMYAVEYSKKLNIEHGTLIAWNEKKDGKDTWYQFPSFNKKGEIWFKLEKIDECSFPVREQAGKVIASNALEKIIDIQFKSKHKNLTTIDNKHVDIKSIKNKYNWMWDFDELGGFIHVNKVENGLVFFKLLNSIDKNGVCDTYVRKDADEYLKKGTVFKIDILDIVSPNGLLNPQSLKTIDNADICPIDINEPDGKI